AAMQRLHQVEDAGRFAILEPLECSLEVQVNFQSGRLPVQLLDGLADLANLDQHIQLIRPGVDAQRLVQYENAPLGSTPLPVRQRGARRAPRYGNGSSRSS